MIDDGLFFEAAPPFDDLLERCTAIQRRANQFSVI